MSTILPGRVIDTRYPAKSCAFCGTSPVAYAFQDGAGWQNACAACGVSHKAQVIGLLGLIDKATFLLSESDQQTLASHVSQDLNDTIAAALASDEDATIASRKAGASLRAILTIAHAMAPAPAAPVKANRFPGKCAECGTNVATGEGRLTQEGGRWVTHHLVGACPEAPAAAPRKMSDDAPLAASEAARWRTNGRDGKCLSCGHKVEAGKGYAAQGLPDARGWVVLHPECADSLAADRTGLAALLTALGERVKDLTGTDTRDHAVRLATDFVTADGDGSQPIIFLRVSWSTVTPGVQVVSGAPGQARRTPVGARRAATVVANLLALSDAALVKAQADYGRKMGECGRCGADLTDAESRRIGLGPDCASKHAH